MCFGDLMTYSDSFLLTTLSYKTASEWTWIDLQWESATAMTRGTLLVLGLLLVAGAVADYGWRSRQEYKFIVEGRSLSGLALKSQYAGVHYRGILRIQSQSPNLLYMKLQDMTYMKIHEEIPAGWWGKVSNSDNPFRDLPITGTTIAIKLDRGQVESVTMENGIEDWEQNFIHGLVSQLQMDLMGVHVVHDANKNIRHRLEKEASVYKVMEDSVLGNCEVMYEISPYSKSMAMVNNDPLPRDDLCGSRNYLEVTKTRNFSNCEVNVEYHFGLPRSKRCQNAGTQCGDIWSRSSVTRVLGCGGRSDFLVLNSLRSSRIMTNLHFHNGSQATVNSYLNLTLDSVKPTSRSFNAPTASFSVKSLVFKYSGSKNGVKKEGKYEAGSSSLPKKNKSSVRHSFEDSEQTNPTSRQKSKSHNKKLESSEMYSDAPANSQRSKKKQHKEKKTKKFTTPAPSSSESSEESNEDERNQIWRIPMSDNTHAPHVPFSPYTLAYRQENEGSCLVQQFKDLMNDIVNDFEASTMVPEKRTMEKLYIAVQMCQTMSIYDLRRVVTGVVDSRPRQNQRHLTERKIYRDVLTICGTNPAFQMIKTWIEEKIVKGEEAAEIITALPSHMLTPDSQVVKDFYDLIRSSAVRDDSQLKISAILAFSNLLRVACVNTYERQARYPVNAMWSVCSPKDASRYIPWIINQLKTESDLRLVYINALGNTGSNLATSSLQNIAESNSYSTMQRASAVLAMKFQVFSNKTTIPILLNIFHNTQNPTSVRIAAVSMLFYAKPSQSIWQRVAISTWYETNPAVAAYVRSSLSSMSVIKDSVYKELSQNAFSVFSLSKPVSLSPHRAYNLVMSSTVENLQKTILEQFSWIPGPDASNIYYRHTERLGGMSRVGFDGVMWLTNPDAFYTILREFVYSNDDMTRARPMIKNLPRATRWIRDALKIEPRELPRLEGALRFTFSQLSQRIFIFDKKVSADLTQAGRNLLEEMKGGKQFHYQKLEQSSMLISTSTEMGFLVNMHVDVPWALRMVGNATLNNKTKEFNMETSVTYISQLIADISVFTEWDQSIHVAASYGLSLVNLPPMSFYAKLNKPMSMVEMAVALKKPNANHVLVHHSRKSFTAQEDAFNLDPWSIAKSTRVLHMKKPSQMEFSVLPHVKLVVSTEAMKRSPYNYEEEAVSVQGFPMMWSSMESNSFEVHLKNISEISIDIGLGEATLEDGVINITRKVGEPKTRFKPDTATSTTTEQPDISTTMTSTTEVDTTTKTVTETSTATETSSQRSTTEAHFYDKKQEPMQDYTKIYSIDFVEDPSNFNATLIRAFDDHGYGSSYNYMLNQILKGIKQGRAFVLGMNMTVTSEDLKEYKMLASYAGGMAGRLQRMGIFFKDNQTSDEGAWTASVFTPSTPVLDFSQILRSNMISSFYSDYVSKEGDDHYQIALEGVISRSERKMGALRNAIARNSSFYRQCLRTENVLSPDCNKKMQDASLLNQYNLSFTYNDKVKTSYADVAGFHLKTAKYTLLPYLTEVYADDSEEVAGGNTVQVELDVDEEGNTADLLVRSPATETRFSGVPIHNLLTSALRKSPEYSIAQRLATTGYCGISNNSVVTYDGVQFNYNLGNCWHVMSKDCSGKSRIVVLVKRTGLRTNQTELEVNLDNYKVVSMKPGPHVSVNQRPLDLHKEQVAEIKDQEGTLLIQMAVTPDEAIKMVLPSHGFLIVYTNNTVIVQADAGTQGRLCGFCGNNDNQPVDEFKSPRGKVEATPFEFASSYALKDAECKDYPKEPKKSK